MASRKFKILLVEDNIDHKDLILRNFNSLEKTIDHVVDGEAALDYLFRRKDYSSCAGSSLPDLVLLDLSLPKLDGIEVLKEIKKTETLKHIPVVILTSSESKQDRNDAYKHHANSFLVKPIDYDAFMELMQAAAKYWMRHNRSAVV